MLAWEMCAGDGGAAETSCAPRSPNPHALWQQPRCGCFCSDVTQAWRRSTSGVHGIEEIQSRVAGVQAWEWCQCSQQKRGPLRSMWSLSPWKDCAPLVAFSPGTVRPPGGDCAAWMSRGWGRSDSCSTSVQRDRHAAMMESIFDSLTSEKLYPSGGTNLLDLEELSDGDFLSNVVGSCHLTFSDFSSAL